ncbi:hypothetical protein SAMN05877842_110149 [Ureibacillus acetophenoni]|uniref:Uncharacterized protein n=1 Tax=Ureibacillus acetophenoni TaxID=614649 RepID=A0A285UJG0_9BACL|nr:hypothetical protein SAMN05877842_110149 [Ureibacillus acetophenoni]
MILGSIGMILFALGGIRFAILTFDVEGYLLSVIGFSIVINYIYSLEKKAGISNKFIWIRSGVLILIVAVISYSLYL